MARTSYQTYLMYSENKTTYQKLIDIKDTPDLGNDPDTIDITTLSDNQKRYLMDIKDPGGALAFTANYDPEDYARIDALAHKQLHFAVWFGASTTAGVDTPDGNAGKFEFDGELSVYPKGTSVSSAVEMGISIAPSSEIKFIAPTTTGN